MANKNPDTNANTDVDAGLALHIEQHLQQLTAQNEHLRLSDIALKSISQGVIICDLNQCILSVNNAFISITGYSASEILGRNCKFLQGPLSNPHTIRDIGLALQNQRDFNGEILNYRKDGSLFWNDLSISPIKNAQGQVSHYVGITRDITDAKRTKEQLRQSEQNLAITLQSIGDGVIVTDAQNRVSRMNPSAERLTGWSQAEAINRNLSQVFQTIPPQPERLLSPIIEYTEHRQLHSRDGHQYTISKNAAPIYHPDGQLIGVVRVIRDVTHEYRMRDNLASTKELLERTGELAKIGGWQLDLSNMKLTWTLETFRIAGISPPTEPTLEQAIQLFATDAQPIIRAAVQTTIDFGTAYDLELPIINAQGLHLWVRTQGFAVTEQAKTVKLLGTFQDITEHKQAKEALLSNRDQLAHMIDAATDAIISTNAEFRIIIFNHAAEQMFGFSAQVMLGTPLDRLLPHALAQQHSQMMHQFADTGIRSRKMGGQSARQVTGVRADGNEFPIEVSISYSNNCGAPIFTAMVRDITERILYETSMVQFATNLELRVIERTRQLEEAKQQAEQANRAKSFFLANMSHEIRTPLNTVLGMAYLAQQHSHDPRQRDYLHKISLSGQHLLDLISDILDLSKIEASKLTLDCMDFDLAELLNKLTKLLQHKVDEKGLTLQLCVDPNLALLRHGDDLRIRQVLLNLLTNAIKFTHQGRVLLQISQGSEAHQLEFLVKDTGIGISAEAQSQLFQSFQQANNSTSRKYGGTGLGLAISQQLVRLMGGELSLSSQAGQGCEFHFSISLPPATQPVRPLAYEPNPIPQTQLLRGKRILLADDHLFNQQIGAELLTSVGAEVYVANNGLEAIKLAQEHPVDLILMDLQMPELDGLQATQLLRQSPHCRQIPIVAMTANVSNEERQHCFNVGMTDFIGKPIQPDAFYRLLAHWLQPSSNLERSLSHNEPTPQLLATEPLVFDLRLMTEMLGEDPQRQRRYLALFVRSMQQGLNQLQQANTDLNQIGQICHRLKSIAGTVGAIALSDYLANLEQQCQNLVAVTSSAMNQLQTLFQTTCQQLVQRGLLEASVLAPESSALVTSNPLQHLRILLLDDDEFMLEFLQQQLHDLGIQKFIRFNQAQTTLDYLSQQSSPDWLLCDLQMPDMDGIAFLRQLSTLGYQGNILICSGMEPRVLKATEQLTRSFGLNLRAILSKPIQKTQLLQLLSAPSLSSPQPQRPRQQQPTPLCEDEIRQGLISGALELYFQPKISALNHGVLGAESLARWHHPSRGILGPELFIPAMESLGLMDELTFNVLELAVRQLRDWQQVGQGLQLSINVSMDNLYRLDLPELFAQVLRQYSVSPQSIMLEITETQLSHDYLLSLDILTRLRIQGFGLSIDDFGTGFSTMEHLLHIPFSELKIDKTFVSGSSQNRLAQTILEHSANLGKQFSLNLVAEGIETQDDLSMAIAAGCHELQGYLIARPMPAAEFSAWKQRWEQEHAQGSV